MKNTRTKSFLLALFSYFTLGSMVLTANTVLRSILVEYSWTDAQGGFMISCLSIGNLVSSVVGNIIMDKFGRRRTLMALGGIMAGSFALFALSPTASAFYPLMFIAGLSWGGINNLTNTVVSELYDGSSSRLNVMHSCYAVGAVLFPLLVGGVTGAGLSWRIPVYVIAFMGLLIIALSAVLPLPEVKQQQLDGEAGRVTVRFWRELRFYLGCLTFFCYVGVETSACAWLSTWLSRSNPFFQSVPAETMVSLMWLLMLAGRLLFAGIGAKVPKGPLLFIESCGFLLGMLGIIYLAGNTALAIVSVAFMGLNMSAIYASSVANNARYIACSSVAPGLLFAGGGLGSAVVPYVAGLVSDASGMQLGMLSLCAFLAVLVAASGLNMVLGRRERA